MILKCVIFKHFVVIDIMLWRWMPHDPIVNKKATWDPVWVWWQVRWNWAITWTNVDLLSIEDLWRYKLQWNLNQNKKFWNKQFFFKSELVINYYLIGLRVVATHFNIARFWISLTIAIDTLIVIIYFSLRYWLWIREYFITVTNILYMFLWHWGQSNRNILPML